MKLSISAKCSDCFAMNIDDDQGNELLCYDGYVPKFMPEQHYGDYVQLDIDVATGQILNWPKTAKEDVTEFLEEQKIKAAGE